MARFFAESRVDHYHAVHHAIRRCVINAAALAGCAGGTCRSVSPAARVASGSLARAALAKIKIKGATLDVRLADVIDSRACRRPANAASAGKAIESRAVRSTDSAIAADDAIAGESTIAHDKRASIENRAAESGAAAAAEATVAAIAIGALRARAASKYCRRSRGIVIRKCN